MEPVRERWGWYALLLVPFVGMLAVPIYLRSDPELFGFPFFYWYQFVWILLGAVITGAVYWATRR
ncbi:MAG TPA: DUF3311 domain-containing protein [Polyangiaceae bacterium]